MSTILLPDPPAPIGSYSRGSIHNGIGALSGQFPLVNGRIIRPGRLGAELSVDEGREAARTAAFNALAQIKVLLDGFDRLVGILRLDGVIAATDDFQEHARVLDAASDVLVEALLDRGRHARSLISVSRLPLNAPIELLITFACER